MKILVTGAKGFVGKNLCWALKNIQAGKDKTHPGLTIEAVYEYDLDSTPEQLDEYCKNADFVFNLAGVNRPQNQKEFSQPQRFVYPDYVKHTDQRDIEMMMLTSPSVQSGLAAWNPDFTTKMEQVKPVVCYLGRIRIWHVAHSITASIKKMKLPKVWDYSVIPQGLKNGWKRILTEQYNRLTGENINPKRLSALKKRYGLDDMEYGHICRGHDFVQLLGIAMVDSRYSSKEIQEKLWELYSQEDFSRTNLAQNIKDFAAVFGIVVM